MRIATRPRSPRTRRIRLTCSSSPPSGMKSISVTAPSAVSKVVSRMVVPSRYWRLTRVVAGRRDAPVAVALVAEQRGEAGVGIEARQAQPVDRAVAGDQRAGQHVADEPVVLDRLAHCGDSSPLSARAGPTSPVPVNGRSFTHLRGRIWSCVSGATGTGGGFSGSRDFYSTITAADSASWSCACRAGAADGVPRLLLAAAAATTAGRTG